MEVSDVFSPPPATSEDSFPASADARAGPCVERTRDRDFPDSPLTRMAAIIRSNDQLFAELDSLVTKLEDARRYLADAGCNQVLGEAAYRRLRAKYAGVLACLRANRLEARSLLGGAIGESRFLLPRYSPKPCQDSH